MLNQNQVPVTLIPFVPSAPEEWPATIPPLVAAALDRPGTALVIFGSDLRVLYGVGSLESLLALQPGDFVPGAELLSLLDRSATIDGPSKARMAVTLRNAVNRAEHDNTSADLSATHGSRTIALETRSIGHDCWMCTFEDITQQRADELRLLGLGLQDPLTGLGNRLHFERCLAVALNGKSASPPAVFALDLDRFKAVNDALGHAAGDDLLRLIGQRLQSLVREPDVIARMGGDEFAILMTTVPLASELATHAGQIIDLLQRTCLVRGQVVNVGASMGIAIAPRDGDVPARLLQSADLALYQAKAAGGGSFLFFEPAMEERAVARRNLELDFRKALPLGQLEVHYKPRVDIATRSLLGFQSLVRWRHPTRGLMEWAEFEALSNQIGLTVQIGDWTLRTACRDAVPWPDGICVSVITYPAQFENDHLVTTVKHLLALPSLAARKLEIAITEEILLMNEKAVLARLQELRDIGVRIAMDGFGTGYASLSQLASFPFDRVNINRSLIADGSGNSRHRAIVRAITSLGSSLGISTMAEGIETPAELDRIHSDGCATLQGYIPTKGVPASELAGLTASLMAAAVPGTP
ncbi:MAG: EAL domain-containing protein [Bryobacteraceae bacterium]